MGSSGTLDAATLFVVNAASLVVFAVVYIVAWSRKSNQPYWLNLTIANTLFAIAFVMFSQRIDGSKETLLLPNCLLVIGLGFRWQAVRAFFGHPPSYMLSIALTSLVVVLLLLDDHLGNGIVFGGVNVAIAIQIAVIIWLLTSERRLHLPSRWGLIAGYSVILISSSLRVFQGWILDSGMGSLLPADVFLDIHLMAAAIHIVACGAFSLSLAYEQGTEDLHQVALRDPLTGLFNRLGLDRMLATSEYADSAVLIIDIDTFKQINDAHGHAAGDLVIRHCGRLIAGGLRNTDFAARIGGEEFVAVLPGATLAEAGQIAERIRLAAEIEKVRTGETMVSFTVSIGISGSGKTSQSFTEMMEDADRQLYRAKEEGRNRVCSALPDAERA